MPDPKSIYFLDPTSIPDLHAKFQITILIYLFPVTRFMMRVYLLFWAQFIVLIHMYYWTPYTSTVCLYAIAHIIQGVHMIMFNTISI